MMYIVHTLFFSFLVWTLSAQSDLTYSEIRIDMRHGSMQEFLDLGVGVCCGAATSHKHIQYTYNQHELELIKNAGFKFEVIIDDVVAFYNEHGTSVYNAVDSDQRSLACEGGFDLDLFEYKTPDNYTYGSMGGYMTHDETMDVLDDMREKFPNLITERMAIGDIVTHDGNQIFYLKLSDNPDVDEDEPEVFYNSLTHAREPNGMSNLIFYMWYLMENYGTNEEVTFLVDNTEMYFLPIVNPDGYKYNEFTNPNGGGFWRKNRRADEFGTVYGVDLNRNYGYFWGFDNNGSSTDPNSEVFRGDSAFSEPETEAVRQLCNAHNFQIALNYHTFGNLLIHPWGYDNSLTEENHIFKSMGRSMTIHNDYLTGTGIETVGYTVNGDSDDWMYGDTIEKNAIYSFTPEVGPGFWPSQDEIDLLNKQVLRMNLNAANCVHAFATARELLAENDLMMEGTFTFNFERHGLKDGDLSFVVESNTDGLNLINNEYTGLNMEIGEQMEFTINYEIDESVLNTSQLSLSAIIESDERQMITEIEKSYIISDGPALGDPQIVYENSNTTIDAYTSSGSWGLTTEEFVSEPSSITDSPNGDYGDQVYSELVLNNTVDLSNAYEASLNFFAKWEIEPDYDWVQVQASIDGVSFTPLCGNYTEPSSIDQAPNGSHVFDGFQNDWVKESMDLSDFLGEENVALRFIFASDYYVNGDGFYFDDLELELLFEEGTSTQSLDNVALKVAPNPTGDLVQLSGLPDRHNYQFKISDLNGKLLQYGPVKQEISLSQLNQGMYLLSIWKDNQVLNTTKIVKQ